MRGVGWRRTSTPRTGATLAVARSARRLGSAQSLAAAGARAGGIAGRGRLAGADHAGALRTAPARGPRRRRQAPLSGRRVGAPPTPPPPGRRPGAARTFALLETRARNTEALLGRARAGLIVVGGLACAGGTWGYRVTARRTPATATERLGRLHLSTLPRLDGDVERVPRVPPLAPRGNGKATTYRAPLATPGVGAGLTAATISSAVRAFSRSAIRRARRSVSALILAVAPSSGRRPCRRPPCRRRSALPAGASACALRPPGPPRATSRHRRPGTPGIVRRPPRP